MSEEPTQKPAPLAPSTVVALTKIAVAVLIGTCMLLALAVVYLLLERRATVGIQDALEDEGVREGVVDQLVGEVGGCWDSFTDPDVGRVLLPRLQDRKYRGALVTSNSFGMRERQYSWQKPEGVIRVVLLGDSFTFGLGCAQDKRLGVHLERFLNDNTAKHVAGIEVLHLAAASWNIIGECSYLRRQISTLQPDLVIHQICKNDLADQAGVRGFGGMSRFSPQVRQRADGVLTPIVPPDLWARRPNLLVEGLDWESRSRYAQARSHIDKLVAALDTAGARYLLLSVFHPYQHMARQLLATNLQEDQQLYLPASFVQRRKMVNSREDRHWNPLGHESVAEVLYGSIVDRDLLPQLELQPWPQARKSSRREARKGMREAMQQSDNDVWDSISSRLDIPPTDGDQAAQVYGGIDREGRVAPYASFVLATNGGRSLVLQASTLGIPELHGGTARVLVDDHEIGTIDLGSSGWDGGVFALPAEVANRPFVSVRFISDDFVYSDPESGDCTAFKLKEAAIE